jgi:hypothetical protein
VKRAVEPHLALKDMISEWNDIAKLLAERSRQRKSQISQHYLFE